MHGSNAVLQHSICVRLAVASTLYYRRRARIGTSSLKTGMTGIVVLEGLTFSEQTRTIDSGGSRGVVICVGSICRQISLKETGLLATFLGLP